MRPGRVGRADIANGRWRLGVGAAVMAAVAMAGCTGTPQTSPTPVTTTVAPTASAAPSPTGARATSASASPTETPSPTITEPTTTNTLPPPKPPTKPAAKTSGPLTAAALPVPAGWRTVARAGGPEEGYEGNGTWVHARDPRYAAQDVITIGCTGVTRDDYTDPIHALEGTYQNARALPGIGEVIQFRDAATASHYFALYRTQVTACRGDGAPVQAKIVSSPSGSLVDRRTYPDGDWLEVAARHGDRLTLIILTDPGHKISTAAALKIVASIPH